MSPEANDKRFTTALVSILADSRPVLPLEGRAAAAAMSQACQVTMRAAPLLYPVPGKPPTPETPHVAVFAMAVTASIVWRVKAEGVEIDVKECLVGLLRMFYMGDEQKRDAVEATFKIFHELYSFESGPPKEWRENLYDLVGLDILHSASARPLPDGVTFDDLFKNMLQGFLQTLR